MEMVDRSRQFNLVQYTKNRSELLVAGRFLRQERKNEQNKGEIRVILIYKVTKKRKCSKKP